MTGNDAVPVRELVRQVTADLDAAVPLGQQIVAAVTEVVRRDLEQHLEQHLDVALGPDAAPTTGHVEQPMPVRSADPISVQALVRDDLAALAPCIASLLVRTDLFEREQVGIERYGTSLQPFNGRDCLRDALEEAYDLACYLKQATIEYPDNDDLGRLYQRALGTAVDLKTEIMDAMSRGVTW